MPPVDEVPSFSSADAAGAPAAPLSRRARRLAQTTAPVAVFPPVGPEAERSIRRLFEAAQDAVTAAEPIIATPAASAFTASSPTVGEDIFARASDAFGFSPVDESLTIPANAEPARRVETAHVAPRRVRRRLAAAGASLGVMGVAGLIAVSMTLPASAIAAVQGGGSAAAASLIAGEAPTKKVADDEIQAYVASGAVQDEDLAREGEYSTVSLMEVAAEEGIKRVSSSLYTNDPNAAIQWPFMVGVAMSSPYGMRNGRMHAGIDLVPGAGATIQAIADGTVRIATESGGAYGVTVYVDHVIDGQVVTSHYAHMQHGSLAVRVGQKVKVGDTIGKVGNTGRSYGAHLHFEIIINGSTVNPLDWMRKNAGRYSY